MLPVNKAGDGPGQRLGSRHLGPAHQGWDHRRPAAERPLDLCPEDVLRVAQLLAPFLEPTGPDDDQDRIGRFDGFEDLRQVVLTGRL
jgi:hypothetical protein